MEKSGHVKRRRKAQSRTDIADNKGIWAGAEVFRRSQAIERDMKASAACWLGATLPVGRLASVIEPAPSSYEGSVGHPAVLPIIILLPFPLAKVALVVG